MRFATLASFCQAPLVCQTLRVINTRREVGRCVGFGGGRRLCRDPAKGLSTHRPCLRGRVHSARRRVARRLGRNSSCLAKGKCQRQLGGNEAVVQQHAGFGGSDEQQTLFFQQARQDLDDAVLRGAVEVDQHVSAKDDVVELHAWQKVGGNEIALLKLHLFSHCLGQLITLRCVLEVAVMERQLTAAKRILSVHRAPRLRQPARADVDGVDGKAVRWNARVEQRHGHRKGLFAARTRQTQQTQRSVPMSSQPVVSDQLPQRAECQRVAKEPGFRHDHRLHQFLQFDFRTAHPFPVSLRIRQPADRQPFLHRALDGRRTNRRSIQAHGLLQELLECGDVHDACFGSLNSNSRTGAGSKRSTSMRWIKPRASLVTGPR